MSEINFRASSIGKLMTEPKTKSEGPLSVGAKTFIRELAAQEILGIDFVVSSKAMTKGIECEEQAIDTIGYYASVAGEDDQDTPSKTNANSTPRRPSAARRARP